MDAERQASPHPPRVRQPAVAGHFYPADAGTLRSMLDRVLSDAAGRVHSPATAPRALVVPHAGYVYSAATAALAYTLLAGRHGAVRRVVLVGPGHRVWVDGMAESDADRFRTPLGDAVVERLSPGLRRRLPRVVTRADAHAHEHSLEVQVPFLQTVLPDADLVPLVVGGCSADDGAEVLDALWDDETLVVASSDLSHYLPPADAEATDAGTLRQVLALDATLTPEQACGAAPLNALLLAARRRGLHADLLGRSTSGEANVLRPENSTPAPTEGVVGYAALTIS